MSRHSNHQSQSPGTSAGARVFCDTTVRVAWRRYLPFFFAAGFAPDFVVFFETGFLAAAIG